MPGGSTSRCGKSIFGNPEQLMVSLSGMRQSHNQEKSHVAIREKRISRFPVLALLDPLKVIITTRIAP
jgi:hypothetical protein